MSERAEHQSLYDILEFREKVKRGHVRPDDPSLDDLKDFRRSLLAKGWPVIPVGGKGCLLTRWTSGEITPERVSQETMCNPNKINTGIRTGLVVGVDNDMTDPHEAEGLNEIVELILPRTPLRRRGSKGAMLVYRTRSPIKKLSHTSQDGQRLFEILGEGQQFVAYGWNPKGVFYTWEEAEPFTYPLDSVPEVTPDQLHDLHRLVGEYLTELGYKLKYRSKATTKQIPVQQAVFPDEHEDIPRLCRAALQVIENDMEREDWIRMCFAMRDAGLDFDDWRDWSHRWSGGRNAEADIVKAWNSCTPRQVTYRTILHLADTADPTWRRGYREDRLRERYTKYAAQMQNWLED